MDKYYEMLYTCYSKYFTTLNWTGHIDDKTTKALFLLDFIVYLLENYESYITLEDFDMLNETIQCFMGKACVLPYTLHKEPLEPILNYVISQILRTQADSDKLKMLEDCGFRLVQI